MAFVFRSPVFQVSSGGGAAIDLVEGAEDELVSRCFVWRSHPASGWPDDFDPKFPIFSEAIPSYLINFGPKFPVLNKIFEKIFPVTS